MGVAMSQQGAQQRLAGTILLDLSDDLLGHIYACLNDKKSKQSFRHSHSLLYKSTAINAQIWTCTVDGEALPARALACFPHYATLKEVCFDGSGATEKQPLATVLSEALTLETGRLLDVRTVKINGWMGLNALAAAALLVLFPQINEGPATCCLSLEDSNVDMAFFEVLACRAKGLERLRLIALYGDIGACRTAGSLSRIQSLREITLFDNPEIEGLGDLLQLLPHLHTLALHYSTILPGTPLASRSLKRIVLDNALPQLNRTNFPALQLLELHSLDVNDIISFEEADTEDTEALSRLLTSRFSSLALHFCSEFPLKLADDEGRFLLVLKSDPIHLHPGMLQALAPLRPLFCRDVRALTIKGMFLDAGGLAALCFLCENLVSLSVDRGEFSLDAAYTDDHGLLLLVTSLKQLKYLHLRVLLPLRDLLAALLAIAQGPHVKDFFLSLSMSAECQELLSRTMEQWECAKHLLPSVTISVEALE